MLFFKNNLKTLKRISAHGISPNTHISTSIKHSKLINHFLWFFFWFEGWSLAKSKSCLEKKKKNPADCNIILRKAFVKSTLDHMKHKIPPETHSNDKTDFFSGLTISSKSTHRLKSLFIIPFLNEAKRRRRKEFMNDDEVEDEE